MRLLDQLPHASADDPALTAALDLAKLGFAMFPLNSLQDGRCTCGRSKCEKPGKHPFKGWRGFSDATTDLTKVRELYSAAPCKPNWAIATGAMSRYRFNVDIDPKNGGAESWKRLVEKHGAPPATVEQRTGSGGSQLTFQAPAGVHTKSATNVFGAAYPGIDARGDGGYAIVPPSKHRSGGSYTWINPPGTSPVAVAPAWILTPCTRTAPYRRATDWRSLAGAVELPEELETETLDELRARLLKVSNPDSRKVMRAVLNGAKLAEVGAHDDTLQKVVGVIAWALPLATPFEQVLALVRPALAALGWQDGLEHCEDVFLEKLYRSRLACAQRRAAEKRLEQAIRAARARRFGETP